MPSDMVTVYMTMYIINVIKKMNQIIMPHDFSHSKHCSAHLKNKNCRQSVGDKLNMSPLSCGY